MKRRSFLALLGFTPAAPVVASVLLAERVPDGEIIPPSKEVADVSGSPSIYENGELLINFGMIRSADGRMVLDLGAGSITIG